MENSPIRIDCFLVEIRRGYIQGSLVRVLHTTLPSQIQWNEGGRDYSLLQTHY